MKINEITTALRAKNELVVRDDMGKEISTANNKPQDNKTGTVFRDKSGRLRVTDPNDPNDKRQPGENPVTDAEMEKPEELQKELLDQGKEDNAKAQRELSKPQPTVKPQPTGTTNALG